MPLRGCLYQTIIIYLFSLLTSLKNVPDKAFLRQLRSSIWSGSETILVFFLYYHCFCESPYCWILISISRRNSVLNMKFSHFKLTQLQFFFFIFLKFIFKILWFTGFFCTVCIKIMLFIFVWESFIFLLSLSNWMNVNFQYCKQAVFFRADSLQSLFRSETGLFFSTWILVDVCVLLLGTSILLLCSLSKVDWYFTSVEYVCQLSVYCLIFSFSLLHGRF